jgi:hypothetical protein
LDEEELLKSGRLFEKRVADAFQAINYEIEIPLEHVGFDFIIRGYQFPLEVVAIVETKYFESFLVPATVVYQMLDLVEKHHVDKAIIVTTLGFSEKAKEVAEEYSGRIVLLNEIELMERIPRKDLGRFYTPFLKSEYVASSVHNYFVEKKPNYEEIITRIPREQLCQLLFEFVSPEEIRNLVSKRIPETFFYEQFENKLELRDIKQIFAELPKRLALPISQKKKISELYDQAIAVKDDPNLKGDLFEKVTKQIFELVPNIEFKGSDIDDGIEEIDIQLRNRNHEHVWADFEGMIFVECKNWSKPVGSAEIDNFKCKLERNGLKIGIFIALKGVTGSPTKLEGAWGAIKMHLQNGYKIVILDGKDLEDIFRCKDVSETIDDKYVLLYKIGSGKATTT